MVLRHEYPAGVPCWVDLTPSDPGAAVEFYGGIFGWAFTDRAPAAAPPYHVAQIDGHDVAAIGSTGSTAEGPHAWTMHVAVDDAGEAADRVRRLGGRVLSGPTETPGVGRGAICADPAGARFGVWQSLGRAGAELVNGSGTWNFNELATTDPEGAEAFYGSVFGWKAVPVDFGLEQSVMWAMPGYGDFLASIDPDVRRRHAEESLPDDFTSAVAWMGNAAAGERASWATTFATDDPDDFVARAERLGGTIVKPAHDTGPVRMAVIDDPQGARFAVSRYQPDA